jgi:hypothetical protein
LLLRSISNLELSEMFKTERERGKTVLEQ